MAKPSPESQQAWVSRVLGFVFDPVGTDDDPPPPPWAREDVRPPPTGGAAGRGAAVQRDRVATQIDALRLWGVAAARNFAARLTAIDADIAAGRSQAAQGALDVLVAEVQAAFDRERQPPTPSSDELAARRMIAAAVTGTAGTGDTADAALVMEELVRLPTNLLGFLTASGTTVKACRGSVTDYAADLRGIQPRGWPPGATWDQVPGMQRPDTKEVVIAVVGHDRGAPRVPGTGERHGSANLVIHETAHGVDFSVTPHLSAGTRFGAARFPHVAVLPAYERQPPPAGQEETLAESCARFYAADRFSAEVTPALHKYWRDNPLRPAAPGP